MEKKEIDKSPHGWVIIFLIVFTLCIFLWAMVNTVDQENIHLKRKQFPDVCSHTTSTTKTSEKILTTTPSPITNIKVIRNGKVLNRHQKMDTIQEAIKRHIHSLPDIIQVSSGSSSEDVLHNAYSIRDVSLSLHGYEISNFSVGKNFYIYDCTIVPMNNYLMITILMELPEIKIVFKDHPEYSMYCPTINPYIHVVELVYLLEYDPDTLEIVQQMNLSNLRIFMVSWENNIYYKSYEQVKNSPLYKSDIPFPLNIKKEELYDFLMKSGVLDQIPMIFNPPITLQTISNNNTTPLTDLLN